MSFTTLSQIREANERQGGCWFSTGSMAWWDCILEPGVYDGRFFIASNQDHHRSHEEERKRRWSIMEACPDGSITTIKLHEYATYKEAVEDVKKLS